MRTPCGQNPKIKKNWNRSSARIISYLLLSETVKRILLFEPSTTNRYWICPSAILKRSHWRGSVASGILIVAIMENSAGNTGLNMWMHFHMARKKFYFCYLSSMMSLASLVMEYARCLSVVPWICETPETFSRSSWNALWWLFITFTFIIHRTICKWVIFCKENWMKRLLWSPLDSKCHQIPFTNWFCLRYVLRNKSLRYRCMIFGM